MITEKQKRDSAAIKTLNDISKRIAFCRHTLGLTLREVSEGTGLSPSTCFNRENGYRPADVEEYEVFVNYFNPIWVERFSYSKKYPSWGTVPITEINVDWLIWGNRDSALEIQNQELRSKINEMEVRHGIIENDLRRQIGVLLGKG